MTLRGTRPNPAQWLWYAAGGRLPQRCNAWVLHDVTCRTWAVLDQRDNRVDDGDHVGTVRALLTAGATTRLDFGQTSTHSGTAMTH